MAVLSAWLLSLWIASTPIEPTSADGLATMVVFGLGTVPAMMAAGLGGSLLGVAARRHLHAVAAWCLVATGLVSIARGAGYVSFGGEPAGCPLCAPEQSR